MGAEFRDLAPHIVTMLLGGLASSLGLGVLIRRPRGKAFLSRVEWWGLALFAVASVATLVGGFYWLFRRLSEIPAVGSGFPSPFAFLLIGLGAGLPFSLPGALFAWSEQRPEKVAARERKAKAASRKDRLKYAQELVGQLKELSPTAREITATVEGDKGKVLVLKGDLDRQEGDRLVAALRGDLSDFGFQRVEGEGPKGKWWSRV